MAGCAAVQNGLNYLAHSYPEDYIDMGTEGRNRGSYGPKTVQPMYDEYLSRAMVLPLPVGGEAIWRSIAPAEL
jgi:hypothetical protein